LKKSSPYKSFRACKRLSPFDLHRSGSLQKPPLTRTFKKLDPQKVKEFFDTKPDALQREAAEAFGVAKSAIQKTLRKIGYTRKKTFLYKERNDQKRQEFLKRLRKIPEAHRVFIDESGIQEHLFSQYGNKENALFSSSLAINQTNHGAE
jgi:transposase